MATIAHPPRILVRDQGVVAVDKPPGMETTGRQPDDPSAVEGWLRRTLQRSKLWPVHQLDRDTSGLVLFVEQKALVATWAARLKPPSGQKTYLAIVRGRWEHGDVLLDTAIGSRRHGHSTLPTLGGDDPRPARSLVRVLSVGDRSSALEVRLETGRTHQVRLHLLGAGHPLLGEALHVAPPCTRHPRHALHAWRLEFVGVEDPLRSLVAPIPADLQELCASEGLRWEPPPAPR